MPSFFFTDNFENNKRDTMYCFYQYFLNSMSTITLRGNHHNKSICGFYVFFTALHSRDRHKILHKIFKFTDFQIFVWIFMFFLIYLKNKYDFFICIDILCDLMTCQIFLNVSLFYYHCPWNHITCISFLELT